jgi:hypothetical protein
VVEQFLFRPLRRPLLLAVRTAKRLQNGRLDAYLGYMLVAVLAVLAWWPGWRDDWPGQAGWSSFCIWLISLCCPLMVSWASRRACGSLPCASSVWDIWIAPFW